MATRVGVVALGTMGIVGLTVGHAAAHPLGNFSVNHANNLRFELDRIVDDAVVDTAEIPTAQAQDDVDTDGDGVASVTELAAHGADRCASLATAASLTVDGSAIPFTVVTSSFEYSPGQAGLPVSRLDCRLEAAVDLSVARTVAFVDGFEQDRVGWREMTAVGVGARLVDSPVPTESITGGLRNYPVDLLSSPLNEHEASFEVVPGSGQTVAAGAEHQLPTNNSGFFSGIVDRVNRVFNDLIGRRELTLGVGMLAVGLALLLGASHALLPGHGKTVMAAYIAGRQGSVRDAVIVGATVTGTHTGGVLVLGLALTLSASLTGESVLGWLGVVSGLLVAGLGIGLLVGAARHRGNGHGHRHGYEFGHTHGDDDHHTHGSGASHSHGGRSHSHGPVALQGAAVTLPIGSQRQLLLQGSSIGAVTASGGHDATLTLERIMTGVEQTTNVALSPAGPPPTITRSTPGAPKQFSRRGLVGMGIAGGLVPSPSALVILLSAIALGRTAFGILLVVGYGVGMAGTLTLAGVLLVKLRDRYQDRPTSSTTGRLRRAADRWKLVMPYATATLVLVVGIGLAIRSLPSV